MPELSHDLAHDAGAGEDDLRPRRLEPDDRAPALGVERPIELDLALDLVDVDLGEVDDVRVVRSPGRA